jgi:hypothetical protein
MKYMDGKEGKTSKKSSTWMDGGREKHKKSSTWMDGWMHGWIEKGRGGWMVPRWVTLSCGIFHWVV